MMRNRVEEEKIKNKKIHVNPRISQDDHQKLKKLSIACDKTKTSLAAEMISFCLNHPDYINYLQKKYNAPDKYRVCPIMIGSKIDY